MKLTPKFEKTYCSSCGGEFGPGDHGYSHCEDHVALKEAWGLMRENRELRARLTEWCALADDDELQGKLTPTRRLILSDSRAALETT